MKTSTISIPAELKAALAKDAAARAYFESLAPSCQREHAGFVAEARKPATRERRAEQTIVTLRREAGE